jgi:hypothetical protein
MGYIRNKHSYNAERAYQKGLLPLSRINKQILLEAGWGNSVAFFHYLCKMEYLVPSEWHHTTFMFKETKFFNIEETVRYANEKLDLQSLKRIYLKKATKQDILKEKGVEYVTVLFSRRLLRSKADKAIDCIRFNGSYWWCSTACVDSKSDKIMFIKHHPFGEINFWYNKNKRDIERKIIMFLNYKIKSQI